MVQEREEKKLVYVSSNIISKLGEISRKMGISLSKLVEESLKLTIEICKLGYDIQKALEVLRAFKFMRALGGVYIPRQLLEDALSGFTPREDIAEKWYESGKIFGLYLKEKALDPLKTLTPLLEVLRWDFSEVSVENSNGNHKLRCVSNTMSKEETDYYFMFLKGLIEGLGNEVVKADSMPGLIIIEFRKAS